MPSGKRVLEVPVGIDRIWDFIKDMNDWAPLIPGYIEHEEVSDKESIWLINGDLGFMKKKVKLQVTIDEWVKPSKVTFKIISLSDNFSGGGHFIATVIDDQTTSVEGYLELNAGGAMGPMVNGVLKNFVPETVIGLSEAIVSEIKKIEGVE